MIRPVLLLALGIATQTWAAFERPSKQERARALGNLYEEPESIRPLFKPDADSFPIALPGPGDWLAQHIETGQSYDDYCKAPFNVPDVERHIIYLMPIGEFDDERSPSLAELRTYATAFFQMEVKLLPAYYPHELEFEPRTNPRTGQRQIRTPSVMTFLETRLPKDAFCLLGVTMQDLYPDPKWNFVFGEASLNHRVGIYSFVRDDPSFWGAPRPGNYRALILSRGLKTLVHETGHMFTMLHCIYFECVMNGSNHLAESDSRPQHLCPICLRKLHHAIGFDPFKRYQDLAHFYRRQKWYEDSDWVERRLATARQAAANKP